MKQKVPHPLPDLRDASASLPGLRRHQAHHVRIQATRRALTRLQDPRNCLAVQDHLCVVITLSPAANGLQVGGLARFIGAHRLDEIDGCELVAFQALKQVRR